MFEEFLRHNNDAWGQKMLVGVSWDLLWVPFVAAFAVILVHLYVRYRKRKKQSRTPVPASLDQSQTSN